MPEVGDRMEVTGDSWILCTEVGCWGSLGWVGIDTELTLWVPVSNILLITSGLDQASHKV